MSLTYEMVIDKQNMSTLTFRLKYSGILFRTCIPKILLKIFTAGVFLKTVGKEIQDKAIFNADLRCQIIPIQHISKFYFVK